ncbi:MAG: flagellar assembly protein FliW [Candidatus Kapabacteria bacterium]|nr:flagellar assembly protein FliW [Ignavibacteriota bacterium]MCW5884685.1 flagellar assembly protein FliW [Candidatus Kapabacteria bacterium]
MSLRQKERVIFTPHFGEITVGKEYIFIFPEGILGFEDLREFVLISEEESAPFKWLISLEQPEIGFPLLSPWLLDLEYNPGKSHDKEELVLFVIITLEDENHQMTANMKAPIILNSKSQDGQQVILTTDKYSTNHIISKK